MEKNLTTQEKRQILVETYGYDARFCKFVGDKEIEREFEIVQEYPLRARGESPYPLLAASTDCPGEDVTIDGTTYFSPKMALFILGFPMEQIDAMKYDEAMVLACKLTKRPIPERIARRMERKAERERKNKIVRFAVKKFNS